MQELSTETCMPRGRNVLNLFSNFKLANDAASKSRLPNGTVKRANSIYGAEWATFGKQNWRCGMNRKDGATAPDATLIRPHKRCRSVETAGRWPWKSAPAKECVTTHLPNRSALKMDGAGASGLCPPVRSETSDR